MSFISTFFYKPIEGLIRNISGSLGRKVRFFYYSKRLKSCGNYVNIDENVFLDNPEYIELGNHVWIDRYSILIAGPVQINSEFVKSNSRQSFGEDQGFIKIGNYVHLGINTIIQGHSGVKIGDYFTTSAGCKIYSLSNDVVKCKMGTNNFEGVYYRSHPVEIGQNVWLGLNVCVLGHRIDNDVFIQPNSVVLTDIPANKIAGGSPALPIKNRFS